jgi:S1-C subfamily serine protease
MRANPTSALLCLLLTACATSYGVPASGIAEPDIAAAYLPLRGRIHLGLGRAAGAAVVIAPGIGATNAHNANLIDPGKVIGQVSDYDLLYFRTQGQSVAATGEPVVGEAVTAYGQGIDDDLRVAHGVVRTITTCPGCTAPAYFIFSNPKREAADAGPGFSGGPVVDAAGHLVGITFGYKDEGGMRQIYAYPMSRVRAEFSALPKGPKS